MYIYDVENVGFARGGRLYLENPQNGSFLAFWEVRATT